MTTHELKTHPEPFAALLDGRKRHEIRRADRPFAVGDVLVLREWKPQVKRSLTGKYTGRTLTCRVTYLTPGGAWGLPDKLCVMSVEVDRG